MIMIDDTNLLTKICSFYDTYKYEIGIMLVIIIGCAILSYYTMYLFQTGDAHMFNLTNESWGYMKNATIGKPTYVLEKLNASY
jgi:hypothetical protein